MDDYPDARKFYMERAWQRRIEFRRLQLNFIKTVKQEQLNILKRNQMIEESGQLIDSQQSPKTSPKTSPKNS